MDWLEYHEEPVTLHSGATSHWLVRGDLMFLNEPLRNLILDFWIDEIVATFGKAHSIGIPKGGTVWADALAERLGLTSGGPDDTPYPSSLLWVVDDVVTTGKSIMSVASASHRLAVVDRGNNRVIPWIRMPLPMTPYAPLGGE